MSNEKKYPRIVWEGVFAEQGSSVLNAARIVQTEDDKLVAEMACGRDSMGHHSWIVPGDSKGIEILRAALLSIAAAGYLTDQHQEQITSIHGRLEHLCGIGSVGGPPPTLYSVICAVGRLEEIERARRLESVGDAATELEMEAG